MEEAAAAAGEAVAVDIFLSSGFFFACDDVRVGGLIGPTFLRGVSSLTPLLLLLRPESFFFATRVSLLPCAHLLDFFFAGERRGEETLSNNFG